MNILLLGANGQIGWELQRSLAPLGHLTVCGRDEADFEHLPALCERIRLLKPDMIVNAAAFTAVDNAESNVETARLINTEGVGVLAAEAKRLNAYLIHYSTDYVFDGKKHGAYNERDEPNPLNVYGQTKRDGELAIQSSGCNHVIFRTSWIYATRGSNFLRTMLRLAATQDALKIVADQTGAPTSAELVADVTALAIHQINTSLNTAREYDGIYHLSATGHTTWHGFAVHLIETARALGLSIKTAHQCIYPLTSAEYPRPAIRPAHSMLNTNKLCDTFGVRLPHWEEPIKRIVTEYIQQGIV